MERVDVPGITGFVDTDYLAKGRYALDALDEYDLVFIHVEAPDEAGHMGDAELKVRAIEDLDEKVVGTLLDGMGRYDDWRILVLPDHATPVSTKTHTDDLVPFAMCSSRCENHGGSGYNEKTASAGGDVVEEGHLLLEQFLDAS
jgi:2,3-bisphosphoglycerate-independent phosphoglycerate mutase